MSEHPLQGGNILYLTGHEPLAQIEGLRTRVDVDHGKPDMTQAKNLGLILDRVQQGCLHANRGPNRVVRN